MTRSPDDIFAAQFWAWPDPALKRDAHGRVIFINAAFLQMFGGSVEAWQGQVIQGWAAPQPGPEPYRFEIRTPAAEGYAEQVYDWLETCGPDGSGFALARNVTSFVEAQQPAPIQQAQPAEQPQYAPDPAQAQYDVAPEPAPQPGLNLDPSQYVAAAAGAPAAVSEPAPAAEPAPAPAAEPAPAAVAPAAPIAQAEPIEVAQPSATFHEVNPHETAAPAAHTTPDRDFERRALPIENDEAVLGNNWRDAVIAKAIGGDDDSASGDHKSGASANGDAIKILLAEDNAINALLTRTLLEADGHHVETVEDGVLAVEAMKTQTYDMIFMDMRMPNMDGLEATRKIRGLKHVSKDLPIVALTANAFDDDRNACFDSGMNDFMTKPVSAEELSEMVVRWTTQREQRLAS